MKQPLYKTLISQTPVDLQYEGFPDTLITPSAPPIDKNLSETAFREEINEKTGLGYLDTSQYNTALVAYDYEFYCRIYWPSENSTSFFCYCTTDGRNSHCVEAITHKKLNYSIMMKTAKWVGQINNFNVKRDSHNKLGKKVLYLCMLRVKPKYFSIYKYSSFEKVLPHVFCTVSKTYITFKTPHEDIMIPYQDMAQKSSQILHELRSVYTSFIETNTMSTFTLYANLNSALAAFQNSQQYLDM
jgi:hypothetical protein